MVKVLPLLLFCGCASVQPPSRALTVDGIAYTRKSNVFLWGEETITITRPDGTTIKIEHKKDTIGNIASGVVGFLGGAFK